MGGDVISGGEVGGVGVVFGGAGAMFGDVAPIFGGVGVGDMGVEEIVVGLGGSGGCCPRPRGVRGFGGGCGGEVGFVGEAG